MRVSYLMDFLCPEKKGDWLKTRFKKRPKLLNVTSNSVNKKKKN